MPLPPSAGVYAGSSVLKMAIGSSNCDFFFNNGLLLVSHGILKSIILFIFLDQTQFKRKACSGITRGIVLF